MHSPSVLMGIFHPHSRPIPRFEESRGSQEISVQGLGPTRKISIFYSVKSAIPRPELGILPHGYFFAIPRAIIGSDAAICHG